MKEGFQELPEDHWFNVMRRISEKFKGEKLSPMEVRAAVLLDLAGIPSGQYSALQTENIKNGEMVRTDMGGDRVIAEYLTNPAGLTLSGTKGITTRDLCDRYPGGLPEDALKHLDEKTRKIIAAAYDYARYPQENFPHTKSDIESHKPINIHFLPGGIPLVLAGYTHNEAWQKIYGHSMAKIGEEAEVVALEGLADKPLGSSLDMRWSGVSSRGDYDALMKDLVKSGYSGIFTEIDGRDMSRVTLEPIDVSFRRYFLDLPDSFYEKYLAYLASEHPVLGNHIGTVKKLKNFLSAQSTNKTIGLYREDREQISTIYRDGKRYHSYPALTDDGKVAFDLTGNELGQVMYADALAAIKLHLLGKMMNDGHLPKGPIVDYEGANHLPSKSFFLQYPEYAMEIVLRTIPELLAGQMETGGRSNRESVEMYSKYVFGNIDWEQVIREIFRIPFKKIDDPKPWRDGVEIGPNQRPMMEVYPDSYVLDTILSSRREGERTAAGWVKIMSESIRKFAL